MRILITAGATREPIDDVRYVGNLSTGTTGMLIAEEAVRRYHTVHLLAGTGSVDPPEWTLATGLLVRQTFTTAADLLARASRLLADFSFDAVIAAAAVADFAPDPVPGKLSSDLGELVVRLRPTPKVIDALRAAAPHALLVAFKLESGIPQDELLARSRKTRDRCGADLVVANLLAGHMEPQHPALLLDRDGLVATSDTRGRLADTLISLIEQRRAA